MRGEVFFVMFVLAFNGCHGLQELFFEFEILHMFLVKGCRDRGQGVKSKGRVIVVLFRNLRVFLCHF